MLIGKGQNGVDKARVVTELSIESLTTSYAVQFVSHCLNCLRLMEISTRLLVRRTGEETKKHVCFSKNITFQDFYLAV